MGLCRAEPGQRLPVHHHHHIGALHRGMQVGLAKQHKDVGADLLDLHGLRLCTASLLWRVELRGDGYRLRPQWRATYSALRGRNHLQHDDQHHDHPASCLLWRVSVQVEIQPVGDPGERLPGLVGLRLWYSPACPHGRLRRGYRTLLWHDHHGTTALRGIL